MDPGATVNGAATPALLKFSAMQLAALKTSPNPEPTAIITSTALAFPQQSVFDGKGNQWVSDHNNNTILVFTAAQLMATGTNATVPAVVISSAAFNGPLGIVFDSAGNLWVANNGGVPGRQRRDERRGYEHRRVRGSSPTYTGQRHAHSGFNAGYHVD